MSQAEYILAAAKQALNDYGIQKFSLCEVGNMLFDRYQTIKYACDTKNGRQLLSVHVLHKDADLAADSMFFASQLLWLEALDKDSGLCIQTPVRNNRNELITVAPGAPDILLTLTHWVPGELLEEEDENPLTLTQARDMGALLARLYRHSESWTPPPEFTRPNHPVGQLDIIVARLEKARADNRISANDFSVIRRVAGRAKNALNACRRRPETRGLLHGDFTAGNCITHEARLCPIDFDWCCVGNYLGDVARCLLMHEADPKVSHSFLQGYQSIRNLEGDWVSLLEALTLATVLWVWSDSVDRRTTFPELPSFVVRECEKYLCGKHFLFDEDRTWL